jgi:hypothetical protein
MDAKSAGSIRAGGNHAALFRSPTDGKRSTTQARVALLLYGTKEGIQIEMKDFPGHVHQGRFSGGIIL